MASGASRWRAEECREGGADALLDCDAHFYLMRAQASRPAFGDAPHHRRWIGDYVIANTP